MRAFRNLPIRRKLKITVMLVFFLIVSVLAAFFIVEKVISFRRNMVESMSTLANVIGINSTAALLFDVPATAGEILTALSAEPDVLAAGVLRPHGNLFAGYRSPSHPEIKEIDAAFVDAFIRQFPETPGAGWDSHVFSARHLDLIKPIWIKGKIVGHVIIQADVTPLNTRIYEFLLVVSSLVIVLFIVVYMLCNRLHRTVVGPLGTLTRAMESVSNHQNYAVRLRQYNHDEVGILIGGFNDMLAQIHKRDEELEQHRYRLEELVSQRTEELQQSNAKLKKEIAERRQVKEQLARAQKMEAIGTLAAGVAHDLNNVLSGIVSYPELLLLNLPLNSPLKQPLETIRKTGQKAAAIVQDLLALSRRGVHNTEVIRLQKLVCNYLQSPEHQKLLGHFPGIRVETNFQDNLFKIQGSPVHLEKCIMNIVFNAAEAIAHEGSIVITLENKYVDTPIHNYDHVQEGDYVVLTVADTGVGIAPEDLDRIFEPFYTKKKMGRSGTGLGMAVVWGTVKDHNGHIDIQSELGEGTTLSLYFPATRQETTVKPAGTAISDLRGNGESILVVDDVAEQREIASYILDFLGYTVNAVPSGEAAIGFLETRHVDLLVLDMVMDPGLDGLETYQRIISRHPGQRAIIASGFSISSRVKLAQELGAGEYLRKPYTLEGIGMAVKKALAA